MQIIVLGSAAGGGFPQWNCNTELSRSARYGYRTTLARTQSSIAVSTNGKDFLLCNASPDLRQQVNQTPSLHPSGQLRDSPIRAVIVTNGDVDHIAGLLTMRESHPFNLYASDRVLGVINNNSIFNVLNPDYVHRNTMHLDQAFPVRNATGESIGIEVTAFAVPGKIALYLEDVTHGDNYGSRDGDTIGLKIKDADNGQEFFYIPGCADIDAELAAKIKGAKLVFFDGTVFEDNDMQVAGVGKKTGMRMGHISMCGEDGSINKFKQLQVERKVYIHINNTNQILNTDSSQNEFVTTAGWEVAYDGMEIKL